MKTFVFFSYRDCSYFFAIKYTYFTVKELKRKNANSIYTYPAAVIKVLFEKWLP